jgi:uncharacterized membrane protein YebE (DUF533 family)
MRRLIVAAALAAFIATVSACGGDSDSDGTAAATPADTATTTPTDTAANTKEVCAATEKVVKDSTEKFTAEITKSLTAAASGDKSVEDAAVAEVKELFTVWSDGVEAEAENALDPELKSALTTMSDELGKVATEINSFADLENADKLLDTPEFKAADEKLGELCGTS